MIGVQPADIPLWSVPRCWPGETVAILGGGKSLTQEQADYCRGKHRVIAINRAGCPPPSHAVRWVYAPWADWLWGGDAHRFWAWHPEALEHPGIKIVMREARMQPPKYWSQLKHLSDHGVRVIAHSSREQPAPVCRHEGCSEDPGVVHGNNSCCGILSVIAHTGVARVILLGIDVGGEHWHGGYTNMAPPEYEHSVLPTYASFARDLARRGIEVINCSDVRRPMSWFEHRPLAAVV